MNNMNNAITCTLLAALAAISAARAEAQYVYDSSDFATEVVDYHPGNTGHATDPVESTQTYQDATTALGRPTVDTTGDGWDISPGEPVPVNPAYPPLRSFEMCTVGYDSHYDGGSVYDGTGYLELKFDHKVFDNPLNPYGSDLIVFGNTQQNLTGGQTWQNGDPSAATLGGSAFTEAGAVLVSQDGVTWFRLPEPGQTLSDGRSARGADDYAPTLGRVYDPSRADDSINTESWTNQWWAHPTNPTLPVNPAWGAGGFAGMTLAEMALAYDGSAGGTGLDLGDLDPSDYGQLAVDGEIGLPWIQYVRIENPRDVNGDYIARSTEVDAVADVFARQAGDANLDGVVDLGDLGILAGHYETTWFTDAWSKGDFNGDNAVNHDDFLILKANWGLSNSESRLTADLGDGPPTIPEPATLGAVALLAGGWLTRRKR